MLRLGGEAGQVFDHQPADLGGVVAGAHAEEDDAVEGADAGGVEGEAGEIQAHLVEVDAVAHGADEGLGLLHDLLEHEVLVGALGRGGGIVPSYPPLLLDGAAFEVGAGGAFGGDDGHLAVGEVGDAVDGAGDCGEVAGEEALARAASDDETAGVADAEADDGAGSAGADDGDGVAALEELGGLAHGLLQGCATFEEALDQERDDLGVGLRPEDAAFAEEVGAQRFVVLDDAVVDDGDVARAVGVGMGVLERGPAVGGPAGVGDGGGAGVFEVVAGEVGDLPRGLADVEGAASVKDGDARAVVAAVFEPP